MSRQRHPATGVLPLQWPRGDPHNNEEANPPMSIARAPSRAPLSCLRLPTAWSARPFFDLNRPALAGACSPAFFAWN